MLFAGSIPASELTLKHLFAADYYPGEFASDLSIAPLPCLSVYVCPALLCTGRRHCTVLPSYSDFATYNQTSCAHQCKHCKCVLAHEWLCLQHSWVMTHVSSALVSAGGAREAEVQYRAAMKAVFGDQTDCHRHKQCHRSKKTGRNKWTMMEMWAMLVPALTTVVLDYSKLVSSGCIVMHAWLTICVSLTRAVLSGSSQTWH